MQRRTFLTGAVALAGAGAPLSAGFEITRSDARWRESLSPLEFRVMRRHGTESPFTSPLNRESRRGTYHCRGCDLPLYSSDAKFDSGTGWPSFRAALAGAIGTRLDRSLFMTRTECHCRRCGSHLGHIFGDGPPPTGQRHCINGVALVFRAA